LILANGDTAKLGSDGPIKAVQLNCTSRRGAGWQREAVMSVMAQEREQGRIEGRTEGEALGKAKGKAEGKAETLLRLLNQRFHGVPEDYRRLVLAAEINQLDVWIDAVLDAETVEGVFGAPATR
jgi:hypothetical protein